MAIRNRADVCFTPPRRTTLARVMLVLFTIAATTIAESPQPPSAAQMQDTAGAPQLLTFDELVELYAQVIPAAPLQQKLDALLTTPFVDNSMSNRGGLPTKPIVAGLGPSLRIVQWNIERGIELPVITAALSGATAFEPFVDRSRHPEDDRRSTAILKQADALRDADVIILNEVDWGLRRSAYQFVAKELAAALKMNYAYGVEFVEVDPLALGTEMFESVEQSERSDLIANIQSDHERTHALHGNAILSRYRLNNVRILRFKTQGHDWYAAEKKGTSSIEKGRRIAAKKAFLTTISREVRRGGRMFMVAELADEQFPGGRLTVVNAHLEAETRPAARVAQLRELLAYVKSIEGPLVIGGDMNTTGSDSTPSSITREITRRFGNAEYWVKKSVMEASGLGFITAGLTFYRKMADPTVTNIPLLSTNTESTFFSTLQDFRFADGGRFDFRGDSAHAVDGRGRTLSNSNQRASKGFVPTFQLERSISSLGKSKLDWFFVKIQAGSKASPAPSTMMPFFGTTYRDLNYAPKRRMSDHNPISVDLPLAADTAARDGSRMTARSGPMSRMRITEVQSGQTTSPKIAEVGYQK